MSDEYKDIINLPHHVSSKRPQMPMLDRAAQFSPLPLSPDMMTQFMKPHGSQMIRLTSAKRKRKHWTGSSRSSWKGSATIPL